MSGNNFLSLHAKTAYMGKGKLAKFADMERYENVFQYPYSVIDDVPFDMKGRWREMYFHNDNPIVVELGCGKGEYAVGLARMFPGINFIGVDIWTIMSDTNSIVRSIPNWTIDNALSLLQKFKTAL
jgi:tRNA G46 methylase TrmB